MSELHRMAAEDYKIVEKNKVCIILDNVRSLNNVGSAFRTSDAFLVEKIFLCGITGTPPDREINKTALGATETVQWEYNNSSKDVVLKLQSEGYIVYAIEQASPKILLQDYKAMRDDKIAFVFGNEVNGVSEEVMNIVEASIEIPQFGTKHSLNISVTIGIVLWHYLNSIWN